MIISKIALESCLADLPDRVDTEDVMYRLYLMEKIASGEEDICSDRSLPHEAVQERLAKRWQE